VSLHDRFAAKCGSADIREMRMVGHLADSDLPLVSGARVKRSGLARLCACREYGQLDVD